MKTAKTDAPLTENKVEPKVMATDPLAGEDILEQFYRPRLSTTGDPNSERRLVKEKPTHYKVVCISLYNEDVERLNQIVKELKKRGHSKANKSQVIRIALDQLDLGRVPKIR